MGVNSCDRNGCTEIMCDIIIDHSQYVCRDCTDEFVNLIGDDPLPKKELHKKFLEFMETPKIPIIEDGWKIMTARDYLYTEQ